MVIQTFPAAGAALREVGPLLAMPPLNPQSPPEMPMPATVLLADDDEDVRIIYSLGLQRRGFLTILARDGEEALRLATTLRPDVVVLDVDMPHLDGDEVIRALKAHGETAEMPAVLMTASREAGVRARAAEAGCDAFYVKPVSPRLLADAVHGLVRGGVTREAALAG